MHRAPTGNKAHSKALRYLGRRDRTVSEMRLYLKRKEFSPETIHEVVDRLLKEGWLNDDRLAREWARSRLENRQHARYRVRRDLVSRGVDPEVAAQALQEVFEDVDEKVLAQRCAEKKLKTWQGLDPPRVRRRLAQFLSRRGFDGETVGRTLQSLVPG